MSSSKQKQLSITDMRTIIFEELPEWRRLLREEGGSMARMSLFKICSKRDDVEFTRDFHLFKLALSSIKKEAIDSYNPPELVVKK